MILVFVLILYIDYIIRMRVIWVLLLLLWFLVFFVIFEGQLPVQLVAHE